MTAEVQTAKIDEFIERYGGAQSALIQVLQDIQSEYSYLPKEALEYMADKLQIPLSLAYNVATFYKAFSLDPKGKHILHFCTGTACHILGSKRILDFACDELAIAPGKTTKDGEYTIEAVNCVGACALGPIVIRDEDYHTRMSIAQTRKLIKKEAK